MAPDTPCAGMHQSSWAVADPARGIGSLSLDQPPPALQARGPEIPGRRGMWSGRDAYAPVRNHSRRGKSVTPFFLREGYNAFGFATARRLLPWLCLKPKLNPSRFRPTPTSRWTPGEVYEPLVPAEAQLPELTARSIGWGMFLCVIFTVASAYSGLKVGQVMESAIPISILAIGLARMYRRRSSVLENVIITGIGGVAGGGGGGRDLHAAGALHPQARSASGADHLHLPGGRLPGRSVPDSAAPLLRARHARPAALSGSDRDHRSAGHRREGRIAGQAAAAGDGDRRRLRLLRHHVSGVEGVSSTSSSCR